MRKLLVAVLVASLLAIGGEGVNAEVNVSVGINLPHLSIGINVPAYPNLLLIPGYPVYYAPRVYGNYFFYDGFFWAYADDDWYMSYWYNGPWYYVESGFVPFFLLRVPVFYYMRPPGYFSRWHLRHPPRWGELWGHEWERHRKGWDHWQRHEVPRPAPLPAYQRPYSGNRYPSPDQQRQLFDRQYRYQPRDRVLREQTLPHLKGAGQGPPPRAREESRQRSREVPEMQRPRPVTPGSAVMPRTPQPQREERPVRQWRQEPRPGQIPPPQYQERESRRRLHADGYEQRVRERFGPRPQGWRQERPEKERPDDVKGRGGHGREDVR